jgi:hypothetical protein
MMRASKVLSEQTEAYSGYYTEAASVWQVVIHLHADH